jgi:integrase
MGIYVLKSEDYYRNFKQSIKSKDTLESYDNKLKAFMRFKGVHEAGFDLLITNKDVREIEADVIDFIIHLKEQHYILGSQKAYLSALMHFYSINDVEVRRKKISRFLSNDDRPVTGQSEEGGRSGGEDHQNGEGDDDNKPYSREQIARLLDFADIRTKVIILLMASAGLRVGALPLLKFGHLTP